MDDDREKERKLELANKRLLVELGDIHLQLLRNVGKIISLKYHRESYDKAKTKFNTIKEKDISEEVRKKAAEIFKTFVLINKVYVNKIVDGKFPCANEDLNSLEENCKEVLGNIDTVNKYYPQIISDSDCSEAKEGIKKIREELIPIARKFANINASYKNFDKDNFSWQKLKNLYYQAEKEAAISRPAEWLSEFAENQKMGFFSEIALATFEGVEEMDKGADMPPNFYPSTAEELNFLQKIADEFPKLLNWAKKTYDSKEVENIEAKFQWAKEANEKLKNFIQEQRKKIRGSSSSTSQPKKPNPQDQQKIQSQEKEIDALKKQLTELQNQIEELKKNQNNNSPDQPTNPEISQQIESLQNKKQEIESKLKTKQSQQKELKDKVNSQQSENKFNWLYVVIPGAFLLVIMGIVIAYLVGKKSKKE